MGIAGGGNQPISFIAGKDELLSIPLNNISTDNVYKIKGLKGEFIPGQRFLGQSLSLSLNGQLKEAGQYQVVDESDNVIHEFAFNFNRLESSTKYYTVAELEQSIEKLRLTNFKVIDKFRKLEFI